MKVRGVILAAGYGSRFLPITRTIPKEMLPIIDRPCLDLVVQEMVDAGIEDILIITSRRKKALDDWFDRDPELEHAFEASGAAHKLAKAHPPQVRVQFVRQQRMQGTGGALMLARDFAGDDPVLVAFPDDLFGQPNASAQLLAAAERSGCSVMAALDMHGQDVSAYGVMDVEQDDVGLKVNGIIEKPAPGTEPSSLISLGRFVYFPDMFDALVQTFEGHQGGEFYPMAALELLAEAGRLRAEVIHARRWDTGTPLGYLEAVIDHALDDPHIGEAFRQLLASRLGA